MRQSELAQRLRLEKSTTSRLVTQLINRGRVERTPAPGDGRGRSSPATRQTLNRTDSSAHRCSPTIATAWPVAVRGWGRP
ncbi:MarR family transcriptional regulator [Nonomuraea maritima]|uniref:MarR family winged helix-turn-helix transcriptional regulator n=1 Tax=Nonomuraea maritima TaxID=683260 RepID=UPI000B832201